MQDCVIGKGLSNDDVESHYIINSRSGPLCYEEAIINPIWQQIMKEEIEAIERNKMWCLTELPEDAKKIGVK